MSGNQRSPYDARRSPTLHYRSSFSSDGQHPRQYHPTTPVHAHSPVTYNASHPSTTLPPPTNNSTGTFYDPTQAERSDSNSNWGFSGYSRQSSQSQHSPVVCTIPPPTTTTTSHFCRCFSLFLGKTFFHFFHFDWHCAILLTFNSNRTVTARIHYQAEALSPDQGLASLCTHQARPPAFLDAQSREQ